MANTILKKPDAFCELFERKPGADKLTTHYCPGCGHGNLQKIIAETIDEFGIRDRTIMVSPVGCTVFMYYYFDTGNIQVAHGRAPAVATGLKRANPDSIVILYQGDGDLAAIGGNNILQASNRGEDITVFFANNAIYGMTGGQMAPTTLIGQKTVTTPYGRSVQNEGYPIRVSELLATLKAPVYIERTALLDAKTISKTRKAVRKAIKCQIDKKGFSFVETLSACPSGWKITPLEALDWMTEHMLPYYKLGVYRDEIDEAEPKNLDKEYFSPKQVEEVLGLSRDADVVESSFDVNSFTDTRFKIAGFGGQGVLLLGEVLAQAGMIAGLHVSWLPSYGPEMRGGTANCHVILGKDEIGSPTVVASDILVAMNKPSLDKFLQNVVEGGIVFYNSSIIDEFTAPAGVEAIAVPVTQMAGDMGNPKVANMIMLGAVIGRTKSLDLDIIFAALSAKVKNKKLIDLNKQAIQQGIDHVSKS